MIMVESTYLTLNIAKVANKLAMSQGTENETLTMTSQAIGRVWNFTTYSYASSPW